MINLLLSCFHQRERTIKNSAIDISVVKFGALYYTVKGYDIHGCLNKPDKYYAKIQYSVTNNGVKDFTPPSGFVCYTPAIITFLSMNYSREGTGSSGNVVMIDLERFATCIADDSDRMDGEKCIPLINSVEQGQGPQQQMISYKAGDGTYGDSKKTVTVKFPLSSDQYSALNNSGSHALTFTLSVNSNISGEVSTTSSIYLPHSNPSAVPGLTCPEGSKIM